MLRSGGDYAAVVEAVLGTSASGEFVDLQGRALGKHRGIIHYTIGQHKGLGLNLPTPHYVCAIKAQKCQVVLGPSEALFKRSTLVRDCNWLAGQAPVEPLRCLAKVRYRQQEQAALVRALPNGWVELTFDEPQRAMAPGQAAVWYQGDTLVGGGTIAAESEPENSSSAS